MQPDERELLEKTLSLEQENNSLLKSIKRSMRLASIMSMLYWVFIIGSAVGAYYLIQPYIDSVNNASVGVKDAVNNILNNLK